MLGEPVPWLPVQAPYAVDIGCERSLLHPSLCCYVMVARGWSGFKDYNGKAFSHEVRLLAYIMCDGCRRLIWMIRMSGC